VWRSYREVSRGKTGCVHPGKVVRECGSAEEKYRSTKVQKYQSTEYIRVRSTEYIH
jgi:hypothetical protein